MLYLSFFIKCIGIVVGLQKVEMMCSECSKGCNSWESKASGKEVSVPDVFHYAPLTERINIKMTSKEIENEMYNYIKKHDGTTFAELEDLFDRLNYDYRGELEIGMRGQPNISFWFDWSAEAVGVFHRVVSRPNVMLELSSPMVYLIDGAVPSLPVAKTNRSYKHPHWLPIVFSISYD